MLHIKELRKALEGLSAQVQVQGRERLEAAQQALSALQQAPSPAVLRRRVRAAGPDWDGATPVEELPLAQVLTAEPQPPSGTIALGVDGSQILPDRHAPVPYYVLQVGCLLFRYDGTPPQPDGYAELHYEPGELYDEHDGLITPRQIGLQRLVLEMEYLAQKVTAARTRYPQAGAIYAFSDGPLLWSAYGEEGHAVQLLFERYVEALRAIKEAGGVPVGYVERPSGAPLLKLLSLPPTADEPTPPGSPITLPPNLRDADVMACHLPAGGRTPWLQRRSLAHRQHETHGQEIAFCYLNAGTEYPVIARVELPLWALAHAPTVFSVLNHQNALLGGYPYLLMRAHELAVITSEDKAQLERAIFSQLCHHRQLARPSEKARYKATLAQRKL